MIEKRIERSYSTRLTGCFLVVFFVCRLYIIIVMIVGIVVNSDDVNIVNIIIQKWRHLETRTKRRGIKNELSSNNTKRKKTRIINDDE